MDNTDIIVSKPKRIVRKVLARGKKTIGGGSHTLGDVLTAKAIPFRFAMLTLLRRRGIATDGLSLKYLLVHTYNEFSGKPRYDVSAFVNNVAFKILSKEKTPQDLTDARNQREFTQVLELTDAVVNIFRAAADKYSVCRINDLSPEKILRDEEVTMARAVFLVQQDLLRKSRSDNYLSSAEVRRTIYWLLGLFAVIYFINKL